MAASDRVESVQVNARVGALGRRDRNSSWGLAGFRRAKRSAPALKSTAESRARLSFTLLVYFVAIVAIIELAPFGFALPSDVRLAMMTDWRDALTSFALFVPLGFLYPLTRAHDNPSRVHVVLWGLLIASLIAVGRIFEIERDTALLDIVTAGVGAGVGGALLDAVNVRTRASARLAGRLSLEIPLIGLVYLLLPVLIATSVSAADDVHRMLMVLPLGFLGARLLSGIQEHHFGPARVFTARSMALVAAGWAALGVFPSMFAHPLLALGVIAIVSLATLYDASRPAVHGAERRFEADILRSAAPYVVVYFLDALVLPLAAGVVRWHFAVGLTGADGDLARQVVHLLEPLTSLALLGYMLAEARGRRELAFRKVAARVTVECAVVAIALEASRGVQFGVGASALECALMVAAAIVGAGMYHHQRERVRWMLIHAAPGPARVTVNALVRVA